MSRIDTKKKEKEIWEKIICLEVQI